MPRGSAGLRVATLAVLGGLYVAQGLVAGFAGLVLIPTLAAADVSLQAQTGLMALAGLPWVLKVGWGPLLDRFGAREGGRAGFIVAMSMLAVAAILVWMSRGLASGEALADHVGRVQLQWLALSIALSLQDVGTDALALDRVEPGDRGLANGVMLGGHHLGAEGLGGMAIGAAVVAAGASWGLAAMAVVFAALAVVPTLLPAAHTSGRPRTPMAFGPALKSMFSTPAARLGFGLAAVVMLADVATSAVSGEFWVQRLGWGPERIVGELAPLVLGSSVLGYLVAALVVDRLGHASATWTGAVALGALWVAFALAEPWWSADAFMRAFVGLQTVATALMYVGVHALLMGATSPKVRATHFAVLMALLNLPRVLVPPLAPGLLGTLGFAGLFAACGVFQLAVGLWVRRTAL